MKFEDFARKTVYFGLGLASYSKEKIENITRELVEAGEIKQKEVESFKEEMMKKAEKEKKEFDSFVEKQVKNVVENLGLVTKDDLKKIEKKIDLLEKELRK